MDGWALLEAGARKRGFLISGGEVDLERMAHILLDEFRGGRWAWITLELPEDLERGADPSGVPDLWEIENSLFAQGCGCLCGVDEAGAGPLAGRVYAGAVILPRGWGHPYLNDSKQVTERRREILYDRICQEAVAWSVAWAEVEEIDRINILRAGCWPWNGPYRACPAGLIWPWWMGTGPRASPCPADGGEGRPEKRLHRRGLHLAKVSGTGTWERWPRSIRSTALSGTRGTPPSCTTSGCASTGPCPIHRRTFLKKL